MAEPWLSENAFPSDFVVKLIFVQRFFENHHHHLQREYESPILVNHEI